MNRIQTLSDQAAGIGVLFLLAGLAAFSMQGEALGLLALGVVGLVGGVGVRISRLPRVG